MTTTREHDVNKMATVLLAVYGHIESDPATVAIRAEQVLRLWDEQKLGRGRVTSQRLDQRLKHNRKGLGRDIFGHPKREPLEAFVIRTVGGPHPGDRVVNTMEGATEVYTWPLPATLPDVGGAYVKVSESALDEKADALNVIRGAEYHWSPEVIVSGSLLPGVRGSWLPGAQEAE